MSFSNLRRNSKSNLQFLQQELEKTNKSESSNKDERLWKPVLENGNGYAVIRFLPAPEGETLPWAKLYSHAFEDVGGWYIENSLTTIGQNDPVGELNRSLWSQGEGSAGQEQARKQKRKLNYYSNIYVVKDPANPQNEGRVFLYRYGKKIHDKIMAALKPEFADEQPCDVFNFWEGANFKLKIKTVGGYWNYDSSEFSEPCALSADDDELEEIYKQQYSLAAFTAADQFKSYEQLQERLDIVLGNKKQQRAVAPEVADEEDELNWDAPTAKAPTPVAAAATSSSTDEEDAFSFFQDLANKEF